MNGTVLPFIAKSKIIDLEKAAKHTYWSGSGVAF